MDLRTDICHTKLGVTISIYYPAEYSSDVARTIIIQDVTKIRNWCDEKEIEGTLIVHSDYFDYALHMYCSEYSITFKDEKYATLLRMAI